MKTLIIALTLLFTSSSFALSLAPKGPEDIYEYHKRGGSHPELSKQIAEMHRRGFESQKVEFQMLSGSCGFAGCDSVYLVTDLFQTSGANIQTDSIMALVKYGPNVGRGPQAFKGQLEVLPRKMVYEVVSYEQEKPEPVCMLPEGCHKKLPQGHMLATILNVERNNMFPVETITLTAEVPCGVSPEKFISQTMNSTRLAVTYKAVEILCLALPEKRKFTFTVDSMTPVNLDVLGLLDFRFLNEAK